MKNEVLSIWTVYDHPTDYPNKYVAREFHVSNGITTVTNNVIITDDLEEIRDAMHDRQLIKLLRSPDDDLKIIESWI